MLRGQRILADFEESIVQFDEVHSLNEELAVVKYNDMWRVINIDGKVAIQSWYGVSKISDFSKGLAVVKVDGKWGYMNTNGKRLSSQVLMMPGYF